jgi:hypothetical protein
VKDAKPVDESRKKRIKSSRDYSMLEVIQCSIREKQELRAMGRPQKCTQDGVAIHEA